MVGSLPGCCISVSSATAIFGSRSNSGGGIGNASTRVHMMPINLRRVIFESSQEVFAVPLRSEQGGSIGGDSRSHLPDSVPHPLCTNVGASFREAPNAPTSLDGHLISVGFH